MTQFKERQNRCVELLEGARAQMKLLEVADGGSPSEEWAILASMQMLSTMFAMKSEYQAAAAVVIREFCGAAGVDFEHLESYVLHQVSE